MPAVWSGWCASCWFSTRSYCPGRSCIRLFALHYAHDYYLDVDLPAAQPGRESERLIFPGEPSPTYGDFLYFSFTIGMTFQTSDVQIADSYIRRVVVVHGAVAFFYTTGILALTISLVAGLI